MNEIATRPTTGFGLISRDDLAKSLNNAAMSMPNVGGDLSFLKMDKNNGDWLFGQEETVVESDSLWAVNPMSLKHGFVAWDTEAGGPPVQEIMVSINRPLPPVESLPALPMSKPDKKGNTYQLEYQQQRSVELVCVSGEDEGTKVEYKQSSVGAMKLFGKLTNALLDQLAKDPDKIVAIGKLNSDTYPHKKYGKITNPLFDIVEWRTVDNTAPVEPEAEAPKDAEPAARTRTRSAAPESAPEADEEADLAKEYEAAAATAEATPRRRQRR